VARPSERDEGYVKTAEAMGWSDLADLWEQIKVGDTPEWDGGKALEHLIVRGFILSRLEAEYPYDVPPGGKPLEQIDGLVYLQCYAFLLECKDKDTVDIEAIAKLRNQLLRRPDTTFGCVFAADRFTAQALVLVDFSVPHRILLWSGVDIEDCVRRNDFAAMLLDKYRHLCKYGLTDHSPNYKELEV
jgi:hypothetical protein